MITKINALKMCFGRVSRGKSDKGRSWLVRDTLSRDMKSLGRVGTDIELVHGMNEFPSK